MFRSRAQFNVGDLFSQEGFDQLWFYKVVAKRYKSGFKYKLESYHVDNTTWSSGSLPWMNASEILREYRPVKNTSKYLYV